MEGSNDEAIINYYYHPSNPFVLGNVAKFKQHLYEKFGIKITLSHLKYLLKTNTDFAVKNAGKIGDFNDIISSNMVGEADIVFLAKKVFGFIMVDIFSQKVYLKIQHSHTLVKIKEAIDKIVSENQNKFPFKLLRTDNVSIR